MHRNAPQIVTNLLTSYITYRLFTSYWQVVFALFIPKWLEQVWKNMSTTYVKLDGLVTCIPDLLQGCYNNIVTALCCQSCSELVENLGDFYVCGIFFFHWSHDPIRKDFTIIYLMKNYSIHKFMIIDTISCAVLRKYS